MDDTAPSDWLLNSLRRQSVRLRLNSAIRILRAACHFGPWRVIPRFLIRNLRPMGGGRDEGACLLNDLDAKAIATAVRRDSFALAGRLPECFVKSLRSVTDRLPIDHYQHMHRIDEHVRRLSEDPAIKQVLRTYFGCEPVLLESTLMVTGSHRVQGHSVQNIFHFDYAGWESLNVFVYLSDIAVDSSAHVVVKGSHRSIGWRDVIRGSISDEEAQRRFGGAIETVIGPAGTVFFENTEAFHRRNPGEPRRVMLNLLYASHRGWLSHGRASRRHLESRAHAYKLALAASAVQ